MGQALSKRTKTPVVVRNDYVMYLELFDNILWFHTDVHHWTNGIKKLFVEDLKSINKRVTLPIKALVTESDKKLAKFGKVTNWEIEKQIVLDNGDIAYIYSWSK